MHRATYRPMQHTTLPPEHPVSRTPATITKPIGRLSDGASRREDARGLGHAPAHDNTTLQAGREERTPRD
jgi:hypothetical protein